jgi:hypothetical protein
MNPPDHNSSSAAPRGFRRVAPALTLFFLSPFVAEFLLGNISVSKIGAMLFLAPLYGGGAVVIREIARRRGRGWPTILLLALAYGLLEEGIVIHTLFNPNYLGLRLLDNAYIPALGIGAWWTLYVLALHTVWSISVPIAVVESLFANRRTTPWLGRVGLGVSGLLLAAGAVLMRVTTRKMDPFAASTLQQLTTWGLIVAIVALALGFRRIGTRRTGAAPAPAMIGAVTFVLGLVLMAGFHFVHGWPAVGGYILLYFGATALLLMWSRRTGWTPLHTFAAAGGAMLTYACTAFPQQPVFGAKGAIDLVGNILFAAIAVTLLVLAVKAERKLAAGAVPGGPDSAWPSGIESKTSPRP